MKTASATALPDVREYMRTLGERARRAASAMARAETAPRTPRSTPWPTRSSTRAIR